MSTDKVYKEILSLARFIQETKSELESIKPAEIYSEHIPKAVNELDAIVLTTEEAATAFLDCAEAIEKVSEKVSPEIAEELNQITFKIYEAGNFQDLTGQRITKVVKTLKYIEDKIHTMIKAISDDLKNAAPNENTPTPKGSEPGTKSLANGPQLPGQAPSQEEIDALMASLEKIKK